MSTTDKLPPVLRREEEGPITCYAAGWIAGFAGRNTANPYEHMTYQRAAYDAGQARGAAVRLAAKQEFRRRTPP